MAMAALKVTPAKLSSKATEFSADAKTMKGITDQMFQLIKQLNGDVWSGTAEKAYTDRFKQLENDCEMLVKMIREFSDDLKDIADEYSKAEKANEETARALKVNVIS